MADFNIALPITLQFEGGYVHNPADPGGETNHGITMNVFQYTAHPLLGLEPCSDNLKKLTAAQAGIIYRKIYWDKIFGDQLPHQPLANIVFDFYVNSGTHATCLLQKVLNQMECKPTIVVDGKVGQGTLNAIAALAHDDVYTNYRKGRIAYYQSLGAQYPMFLNGWLHRANAFPEISCA